jgi:hypothetical protein
MVPKPSRRRRSSGRPVKHTPKSLENKVQLTAKVYEIAAKHGVPHDWWQRRQRALQSDVDQRPEAILDNASCLPQSLAQFKQHRGFELVGENAEVGRTKLENDHDRMNDASLRTAAMTCNARPQENGKVDLSTARRPSVTGTAKLVV